MFFNSLDFLYFLFVVLILVYFGSKTYKKIIILLASYAFYAFWDERFLILILISTLSDFFLGSLIHKSQHSFQRKIYLWLSITVNLGILGFFKYYNFFCDSLILLLQNFNVNPSFSTLKIVLPVGISFYTFQTMSYSIDIYRKELKPTNSLLDFSIFVAFFPQLVAGPIERAKNLLPQIQNISVLKSKYLPTALTLIFMGYVRKVLLADNIAPLTDEIFNNYQNLPSADLLMGLFLFSLQIYFDFSGYSQIARGLAALFGIHLMKNFNQAYFAHSFQDFWKRWHISLSTWLRDYLYIPLGGNQKGRRRRNLNLLITMLLGGLWHGASWNFVLWGYLHGCYLIIEKTFFSKAKIKVNFFRILGVYLLILLTWLPFRSTGLQMTYAYLEGFIFWSNGISMPYFILTVLFLFSLLLIDLPAYFLKDELFLLRLPKGILYGILILGSSAILLKMYLTIDAEQPFMYFQF